MNKDQIKGVAKEAMGSIKEATGKVIGNEQLQADGVVEQAEGKIQKSVGDVKDAARDALKR